MCDSQYWGMSLMGILRMVRISTSGGGTAGGQLERKNYNSARPAVIRPNGV
jgi:hypothetical protein